jgi:hypothetical protein
MASSDRLKPGEQGSIRATLSLNGLRGHVTKQITVRTNDPKRPFVALILKAVPEKQTAH